MDTGLVRVLILAALFLLLAGDFGYVFNLLTGLVSETKAENGNKHVNTANTIEVAEQNTRNKLIKACFPKMICELKATPHKEKTDAEKMLLNMISDSTISSTAEVTSKYHFAAHMGQLIAGIDGAGCHNFYPSCPIPGAQVVNMMKSIRLSS